MLSFEREGVQEFENDALAHIRDAFDTIAWARTQSGSYDCAMATDEEKGHKCCTKESIRRNFDKILKYGSSESKCDGVLKAINNIRASLDDIATEILNLKKYQAHEHHESMRTNIQSFKTELLGLLAELERETNKRRPNSKEALNISAPSIDTTTPDKSENYEEYEEHLRRCVTLTEYDAVDKKTGKLSILADSFIRSFLEKYSNGEEGGKVKKDLIERLKQSKKFSEEIKGLLIGIVNNWKK